MPLPSLPILKITWLHLAILSGFSAACNGFFAKLTTGDSGLTHGIIDGVSSFFGAKEGSKVVEYTVRAIFFATNMLFDSFMWALFTTALARGPSATTVGVVNTSTNFLVAASLGFLVFSEKLPLQWWIGASLLVIGNVVISRKGKQEEVERRLREGNGVGGAVGDGVEYMPLGEGIEEGEEAVAIEGVGEERRDRERGSSGEWSDHELRSRRSGEAEREV